MRAILQTRPRFGDTHDDALLGVGVPGAEVESVRHRLGRSHIRSYGYWGSTLRRAFGLPSCKDFFKVTEPANVVTGFVEKNERLTMDEDDKVRRNLVVFSGSVLVTNYLDISVSKLATEFFKLGNMSLDPSRVLCLSLVILVYLAVRYRFSEEGIKYSQTLESEWEALCVERTQRWARLALILYVKRDWKLRGTFAADVADVLKVTSAVAYQANNGVLPGLSSLTIGNSSAGPKPWIHTAFIRFQWTVPSDDPLTTEGTVDVHFSGLPLLALKLTTYLQTWFYSKGSIHALVPAVVGNLAGITLLVRVFSLFPH